MKVRHPIGLAAFDLDGTLLRGQTVCEAIALQLGHSGRMRELESLTEPDDIRAAREEMVEWYRLVPVSELHAALGSLQFAPGALEGFRLLKEHRISTAIVSITWEFAVEWFARQFDADYFVGTKLL